MWCTIQWCRISKVSAASYFSVKQKHRVWYRGDVSICLSNQVTWTRKNLTPSFLETWMCYQNIGLSNQRYWRQNITQIHHVNGSLHISNHCCDGPPSHETTTTPTKPMKVAWWWGSWFLIVTIDTAQTSEEAGTLKVLHDFCSSGKPWKIKIWIQKMEIWKTIIPFQFTQLQDICIPRPTV